MCVKPVSHPEEIWGHRFQVGVLGGRALATVPLAQRI